MINTAYKPLKFMWWQQICHRQLPIAKIMGEFNVFFLMSPQIHHSRELIITLHEIIHNYDVYYYLILLEYISNINIFQKLLIIQYVINEK